MWQESTCEVPLHTQCEPHCLLLEAGAWVPSLSGSVRQEEVGLHPFCCLLEEPQGSTAGREEPSDPSRWETHTVVNLDAAVDEALGVIFL